MIRNNNDIVIKIYYNGNEISKVFQKQIQVYPDQKFADIFWLKVNDISDNKTYYYLCKKTNVIYDSEEKISEITYETTTKQENEPGDNQQIFELLNDDVEITGQNYERNDFESFEDKTPNEVLAMTQTYQEKLKDLVNIQYGLKKLDETFTSDGKITYIEQTKNEVDITKFSNIANIPDEYTFCYSDYTDDKDYKMYQIILQNISGIPQTFYYITAGQYERWTYGVSFVTDNLANIGTYTNRYDIQDAMTGSGWTNNKDKKRDTLYGVSVPNSYYISFYISLNVKSSGETFYNIFAYLKNNFNIIKGNILNHKYISDDILEKQIKKIKYNYVYAMVKNDLSNVVYQTNCKYILSKEELEFITCNYALVIPVQSLGWKLLEREEWLMYMPYNTAYKMSLTVANFAYTGDEFFGLLDKSNDYADDFRIFGYGNSYIYMDPGSYRWDFNRNIYNTTNITFTMDGMNNEFNAYENGTAYGPWTNINTNGGFPSNPTTLYLNAYSSESNLTSESLTFYEFKIEDKYGNLVKRIVPSDDPKRLYETVSQTYIEPCRTVEDASLPTLIDNIKLGVEPVDGLGNKIENWYR